MTVRDLMRKLIEMKSDEIVLIDAAGRGTYEIATVERAGNFTIVMTDHNYYERESMHDAEDSIQQLTSREG